MLFSHVELTVLTLCFFWGFCFFVFFKQKQSKHISQIASLAEDFAKTLNVLPCKPAVKNNLYEPFMKILIGWTHTLAGVSLQPMMMLEF